MRAKPLPPLEFLRECFLLSETSETGLVWKSRPVQHFKSASARKRFNNCYANKCAGTIQVNTDGKAYYVVKLQGRVLKVHRVIFSLLHKIALTAEQEIDHEDRDGLNNKQRNLRLATVEENQHNSRAHVDGSTGIKGVSWCKSSGRWRYSVMLRGKQHYGFAGTKEKAAELCRELRESLHKEFTRHV